MTSAIEPPVVVVGAGLAGLCCALHLRRRGLPVVVLEAADRVGGCLRTDTVEGFRLDRGFQVLLTSYPEVRCMLDARALHLGRFRPGALVRWQGRLHRVGDPLRRPQDAWSTLTSGAFTAGDAWRMLRLRHALGRLSLEEILTAPARPTRRWLEELGFSNGAIERFFVPFFRGVFLEPSLETSSRFFAFAFRMFSTGDAALPAAGMEAVPQQLAARLPPGVVRTGRRVATIATDGVRLASGETLPARAVVVATAGREAARWLPDLAAADANAVCCLYFDAPRSPVRGPWLVLDADGSGPVSHLCVPSEVSPGYAPPGRALVSASVLGVPASDDAALAAAARAQLRDWFGEAVARWRLLRIDRVRDALPAQRVESWDPVTRPVRHPSGVFVCGAHRETASQGGAMRSGRRAARAVAESLHSAAIAGTAPLPL